MCRNKSQSPLQSQPSPFLASESKDRDKFFLKFSRIGRHEKVFGIGIGGKALVLGQSVTLVIPPAAAENGKMWKSQPCQQSQPGHVLGKVRKFFRHRHVLTHGIVDFEDSVKIMMQVMGIVAALIFHQRGALARMAPVGHGGRRIF